MSLLEEVPYDARVAQWYRWCSRNGSGNRAGVSITKPEV